MRSDGVVEVDDVVAVGWYCGILRMWVVEDFFGVVLCCVLLQFVAEVALVVFISKYVVVVVMVDNG